MTSFSIASAWALRLPLRLQDQLGRIRLRSDVKVLVEKPFVWARGEFTSEADESELRKIAGAERFAILEDGLCVPAGSRVPTIPLPEGDWTSLTDWMPVRLPVASVAAAHFTKRPLRLVRSEVAQTPDVLLTEINAWTDCVSRAPLVRLDRWLFAACADGRIVVTGTPLPSMPGQRFVRHGAVAVPAGLRASFAAASTDVVLDSETLTRAFDVTEALVLWHHNESWEQIPLSEFTKATRSAVRATRRALSADISRRPDDGVAE